jgi:four helix bundle protein
MSRIEKIEDLIIWQKARELSKKVYEITTEGKFAKDFGLRDQIRRSSVSVMSNIAEGFERQGDGEFKRFLSIVKGSLGEVRSQLYVALDVQ